MRLLNVQTKSFEEIFDPQNRTPQSGAPIFEQYAILSHTWVAGQELSHQDWNKWLAKEPGHEDLDEKSGFKKIIGACEITKKHGLRYIWIDTICIDKTSSSELSEAINSMFAWYSYANCCFAYLSDVEHPDTEVLRQSRWFERGWTLQELLAPRSVIFYSSKWHTIGTRPTLVAELSSITGINRDYLVGTRDIRGATIAERMSWAAGRRTTRIEDTAYSLLGIFDINMPLLYGEGEKAFLRLQEEIIKVSTDQTIFAWEVPAEPLSSQPHQYYVSLLALSPDYFSASTGISRAKGESPDYADKIFSMNNLGLTIRLQLLASCNRNLYYGALQCCPTGHMQLLCIPLMRIGTTFARCKWPRRPFPVSALSTRLPVRTICAHRLFPFGAPAELKKEPPIVEGTDLTYLIYSELDNYELVAWGATLGAELSQDFSTLRLYTLEFIHKRGFLSKEHQEKTLFDGAVMVFANRKANSAFQLIVGAFRYCDSNYRAAPNSSHRCKIIDLSPKGTKAILRTSAGWPPIYLPDRRDRTLISHVEDQIPDPEEIDKLFRGLYTPRYSTCEPYGTYTGAEIGRTSRFDEIGRTGRFDASPGFPIIPVVIRTSESY